MGGRVGPTRIDLEPIYAQLKAAIGDKMSLYRDSVGAYMMGMLACFILLRGISIWPDLVAAV